MRDSETATRVDRGDADRRGFWNDKFSRMPHLYGLAPNVFVAQQVELLPRAARVLEIATGQGRNAVYMAKKGHAVTAVDFSDVALDRAREHAAEQGVEVEWVHADVREWQPHEQWDVVVATFLHLLPDERRAFFRLVRTTLTPAGRFIGVFFRPEQVTDGYSSGGPRDVERLVTEAEIRACFPSPGLIECRTEVVELDEGPVHSGPAAVLHVVYQEPVVE